MRSDPPLRAGFSLVEVLIVIVVIGILAAVAIPKFSGTTAKADLANVKSDLHALVLAQETYYNEHSGYAASPALLELKTSQGVNLTIVEAGPTGYSAVAVHPATVPVTCAVFYGSAAPVAPAAAEGVITCR